MGPENRLADHQRNRHPDGLSDALQQHPEIWDELRHLCPDFYGATYEKMGELGYVMWPCRDESDADQGTSYLFKEKFDTPNGLAQFFTCDWVAPIDKLTDEYPMVLSTVREVGHYSCRSMTGNCAALAALADEPAMRKSTPPTPNG